MGGKAWPSLSCCTNKFPSMGLNCGSFISPDITITFAWTTDPSVMDVILGEKGEVGCGMRIALDEAEGDMA